MTRPRLVLAVLALAAVSIAATARDTNWMATRQSEPPHAAPPAAEVRGTPAGEWAVLAASLAQIHDTATWIEEATRAALAAAEAERTRVAPARPGAGPDALAAGGHPCGDDVIPGEIIWRESRCNPDAYNPDGCGGRGCVGLWQLDLGHFAERSPWGGPGGCADLDPSSVDDQRECARRLSSDGGNLRPWGA